MQGKPGAGSGSFNHLAKLGEQRGGIMRPRRGFRMILHAENGLALVMESFNGLIVQIDAVHHNVIRQGLRIDGEAVVLRGDFDLATGEGVSPADCRRDGRT